jgi:hypothetical protein
MKLNFILRIAGMFVILLFFSACGDLTTVNTKMAATVTIGVVVDEVASNPTPTLTDGISNPVTETTIAYTPHSLVGASAQEVSQLAVRAMKGCVISGNPQVVLTRQINDTDLLAMGLNDFANGNNQLRSLVIIKADMDPKLCTRGRLTGFRIEYIAYLINLEHGTIIGTTTSRQGGAFRKALNDPTLPDDALPPTVLPTQLVPGATFQVYTTTVAKPGSTLTPTPIPTPDSKHPGSRGMAAIKPSKVLSAADVAANTPAFTEADVATYLAQPHPEWALIGSIAPIVVDKVEFIPYKLVDNKLNLHLGLRSDLIYDTVVCLVTAHGTFTNLAASNAPMLTPPPGYTPKNPGTFKRAYWVFDIQDGSLKMLGGY